MRLVRLHADDLGDLPRIDADGQHAVILREGEPLDPVHRRGEAPERQGAEHRAGVVVESEDHRAGAEVLPEADLPAGGVREREFLGDLRAEPLVDPHLTQHPVLRILGADGGGEQEKESEQHVCTLAGGTLPKNRG
ncbi:MAG: hypothetical protein C4529_09720 [Deltaproteobacteria bacterium]|nr:MAG: hypothetical protein C4529_09720 [Deltaproteobacteria bacterium]